MRPFDTIIVVDWASGNDTGPRPRADAIWAAVARDGAVGPAVYHRNRQVAESWLANTIAAELDVGRRVLAGFDFPFGFPAGFAARLVGRPDPLALWDWFAARLDDTPKRNTRFHLAAQINAMFPGTGPFWFNGLKDDLEALPRGKAGWGGHGLAERRLAEAHAKGAFPLWQMGGAGAVGGQAMTGMATLSRLRARFGASIAVWPFQPLDAPVALVEVWPSLHAGRIAAERRSGEVKDAAQVRVLAGMIAAMQAQVGLDAALAAPAAARSEEGWILGLGDGGASADAAPALPPAGDWLPVETALERLRASLSPVDAAERVAVAEAGGRVLARGARAVRANPPAANAAVDGYGFAAQGPEPGLRVLAGRAAAGAPFGGRVPPGAALRILTGAILPEGVDTVVPDELARVADGGLHLTRPVRRGANTRAAGEDVAAGAEALSAGRRIGPPEIALLTALGLAEVDVFRRLRVAVLSTGDEIVPPGRAEAVHQIFDANRPMLLAMAARWGFEAVDLGHAPDDPGEIAARLDQGAARADAILTTGGASAGDEDHVARLLRERGALHAGRIAMKPGRPLALARWGGVPVFGLPGNPVAAFVCALIFARPALAKLSGAAWEAPQGFRVPAAFAKSKTAGRREYLRARLDAAGRAEVFASEGSGRISGIAWATGLVELPEAAAEIAPGDPVRFLPYASFGL